MPKVSHQWLRAILTLFSQRRTVTRSEIIDATNLNPASISHALRYLMAAGIVVKAGKRGSTGGRKQEVLTFNADECFLLAVDLEGSIIRFALTNLAGDIRCRWEDQVPSGKMLPVEQVTSGIDRVLANLDAQQKKRVVCIGISHPGLPDHDGHISAINLGWADFPVGEHLKRAFGLPVFFEDAHRTCAQAEHWAGVARKCNNFAYLIVGQGIGVGCFVDGHLLEGAQGAAGELGHIILDPRATDVCKCGKRGCVEAIASTPNIIRQYQERLLAQGRSIEGVGLTTVLDAARRNEQEAADVINRAAWHLGNALAHLAQILNPELIVLGGDLIQGQDVFLPRLQDTISRAALAPIAQKLRITASSLGVDIGLKGAASMAFQRALLDAKLLRSKICAPMGKPPRVGQTGSRRQANNAK